MHFRFNDKDDSLDKKDQAHLDAFFKVEPQCKQIYENPKGEKRLPLMVKRPRGCVAPDTVWGPVSEGKQWYHTPLATFHGTVAQIHYRNPDTMEAGDCTSVEWLEWLGESWKSKEKPKPAPTAQDKYVENMRKAIESGNIRTVTADEFDRQASEEDAKWQKAIPGKSSASTSPAKGSAKKSKRSSSKG